MKLARAVRDVIIEAPEQEFRADLEEAGVDFAELVAQGQSVISRALETASARKEEVGDLHRGLGALVQMLRRRDGMTVEELAETAAVDPEELRAIESDPKIDPRPRTVYQLEQHFKLRPRSLVVLSGAVKASGSVRSEAMRFAAKATSMKTLSPDEVRMLNAFVRFLGEESDR